MLFLSGRREIMRMTKVLKIVFVSLTLMGLALTSVACDSTGTTDGGGTDASNG